MGRGLTDTGLAVMDTMGESIEKLRRERDAFIGMHLEKLPDGTWLARIPWRRGGYPACTSGEDGPYHFDRYRDAVAEVRTAAGLEAEESPR